MYDECQVPSGVMTASGCVFVAIESTVGRASGLAWWCQRDPDVLSLCLLRESAPMT
jgi:hypothetical protein